MLANIDPDQVQNILQTLPSTEKQELLKLLEDLDKAKTRENSKTDFLTFVRHVWPAFIAGRHHRTMADAFERVANGEL